MSYATTNSANYVLRNILESFGRGNLYDSAVYFQSTGVVLKVYKTL